jgi:hypothetical protein
MKAIKMAIPIVFRLLIVISGFGFANGKLQSAYYGSRFDRPFGKRGRSYDAFVAQNR